MSRRTRVRDLVHPLRSEHIVVCVLDGRSPRALFRIFWHPSQDWVFVDFPYFTEKIGLLAELTIPAGEIQSVAELAEIGHIATHDVKYSHHGEGTAHLSKHGYDTGAVGSRSVRLDQPDGHLFTVLIRGVTSFKEAKSKYLRPPNKKHGAIIWEPLQTDDNWLKFRADLMPIAGPLGVDAPGLTSTQSPHGFDFRSDGKVIARQVFLSAPVGWPMSDRTLVVRLEPSNLVVDDVGEAKLVFLGAFDRSSTARNIGLNTTALAFIYPPANVDELRRLLPTTDISPTI